MSTTPVTNTTASPFNRSVDSTATKTNPLADKAIFLQLLVAQLKNQNPLNPADGVQFVTQLAQFSGLEQSTEMNSNLKAIKDFLTATPATPATTATPTTAVK